jgi:hypothetical protein
LSLRSGWFDCVLRLYKGLLTSVPIAGQVCLARPGKRSDRRLDRRPPFTERFFGSRD